MANRLFVSALLHVDCRDKRMSKWVESVVALSWGTSLSLALSHSLIIKPIKSITFYFPDQVLHLSITFCTSSPQNCPPISVSLSLSCSFCVSPVVAVAGSCQQRGLVGHHRLRRSIVAGLIMSVNISYFTSHRPVVTSDNIGQTNHNLQVHLCIIQQ